tara:strand:+ start:178 stop:453 length:276 start_codon:yes stop_codon:yes gene_type:complete
LHEWLVRIVQNQNDDKRSSIDGNNVMTRTELIAAMDAGLPVRWMNDGYECYKDTTGEYLKTFTPNDHTIGIFHRDGVGMNVDASDCYIQEG